MPQLKKTAVFCYINKYPGQLAVHSGLHLDFYFSFGFSFVTIYVMKCLTLTHLLSGSHPWQSPSSRFVSRLRSWRNFSRRCPTRETLLFSTGLLWRRRLWICSETSWRGTQNDEPFLCVGPRVQAQSFRPDVMTLNYFHSSNESCKINLKHPNCSVFATWFSDVYWKFLKHSVLYVTVLLWLKDSLVCPCIQTDHWL